MPTTDWNWFFSSLAQSAAAIVGIFGAFIVTKILANQTAFAEKLLRIQELITLGQKLADSSSRLSFDWYHRNDSADEFESLDKLLKEDDSQSPETLYEKLRLSPYIPRENAIENIAHAKSIWEDRIARELQEMHDIFNIPHSKSSFGLGRQLGTELLRGMTSPRANMAPRLAKERAVIDGLYMEAKHHVRLVSDFHAIVCPNPESSPVITVSLALILTLFFSGVIYPLSFMPLPTDWKPALSLAEVQSFICSLRGVLLIVVSILFTTMLAIFFVMNIRLRYPTEKLKRLEYFKHLSAYSINFSNREANEAHRAAI